jgi:hypothetical protein
MKYFILILFIISIGLIACERNVDDVYPEIDFSGLNAFPQNCDTLYRGQAFNFIASLSDNVQLGSFSLEIHNNFDHHTHSTEEEACPFDEDKAAINPWLFLEQYSIPEGSQEYEADVQIVVPEDIDAGDYHFQIRLTDHEGWQELKGLSIKIL